jgi:hypothetical protein
MNIHFFRNGKNYYYILDNREYEVDDIGLNKLMEQLKLPFTCSFEGMSVAQIQKICGRLMYDDIDCYFGNKGNCVIATFCEKKYFLDVYRVPYKACLFGRNPNCKPYVLSTFNDKTVLMEVPFDYAVNCNDDFYFLHNELTKSEQEFFSSVYTKLEVDYVYNLFNEKKSSLERKKRK